MGFCLTHTIALKCDSYQIQTTDWANKRGRAESTPRDLVCRAMTEPPFLSVVTLVTNMADQ